MRSLPQLEELSSLWQIVTVGVVTISFVVCSVVLAKVAYTTVALLLRGATYAAQISLQ